MMNKNLKQQITKLYKRIKNMGIGWQEIIISKNIYNINKLKAGQLKKTRKFFFIKLYYFSHLNDFKLQA